MESRRLTREIACTLRVNEHGNGQRTLVLAYREPVSDEESKLIASVWPVEAAHGCLMVERDS